VYAAGQRPAPDNAAPRMAESLLILIAGGVMLAAAVPNPSDVRVAWLRLAGVLATLLATAGAAIAAGRTGLVETPPFFRRVQAALVGLTLLFAVTQFAFAFTGRPRALRLTCLVGCVVAVLAGSNLLHDAMLARGSAVAFQPKAFAMALQTVAAAGAASVTGLALMTAAFPLCGRRTGGEPGGTGGSARAFRRLHRDLVAALVLRAIVAVGVVLVIQVTRPVPRLWTDYGLLIPVRWLVGLVVVAGLAAASRWRVEAGRPVGTALLLLAALLAVDAELLALYLVRATGLPF
jgi:hypothetical protein